MPKTNVSKNSSTARSIAEISPTADAAIKNMKDCVRSNIKYIRESILSCAQREFANSLGITHPTISSWEVGRSVPKVEDVICLIDYMKSNPKYSAFATFSIDDFYNTYLDFNHMPVEESDERYSYIEGSYYLSFIDFSEKMQSPAATTTFKLRQAVMFIYRKPESLGRTKNDSPLGIYVIPFAETEEAVSFKKKLDDRVKDLAPTNPADIARAVDCEFQDYLAEKQLSPLDLYRGYANIYDNIHVSAVFENGNSTSHTTDKVSLYFDLPRHTSKPNYIGGMGVMLSIIRGKDSHPLAQRAIVSRSDIHRSEEIIIDKYLRTINKDVNVEAKLLDALALYDRFTNLEANGFPLGTINKNDARTIVVGLINSIYTSAYRDVNFHYLDNSDREAPEQIYYLLKHHASSEKF